jgi:hypothetical protein
VAQDRYLVPRDKTAGLSSLYSSFNITNSHSGSTTIHDVPRRASHVPWYGSERLQRIGGTFLLYSSTWELVCTAKLLEAT